MKRLSGGKRQTLNRLAKEEAARSRAVAPTPTVLAKIGPPPKGKPEELHAWLADVMVEQIQEAREDQGPAPEARREQIGRLIGQAGKIMDAAKLSAKLAEYAKILEEQKANAAPVTGRSDGSAGPAAFIT